MKIKEKMVELKDKSINFVKEHKYDIMVIGLYTAVDLAFYCVGRRDGRIERDRDWQKELDGKVIVNDGMMGNLLTEADHYYGDGTRARRYFDMYVTNDDVSDDTVKVTDLGKIGGEMVDIYKDKLDISNERVTHMMIITDPETGK
nr:MAG TPA: hypothetical protein [Caudoviricetes sp.]